MSRSDNDSSTPARLLSGNIRTTFLLLMIAGGVAYGSALLLTQPAPPPTHTPSAKELIKPDELVIAHAHHDSATIRHRFAIHNPFDDILTITDFPKSCDCLHIAPEESMRIPPRQQAWFRLELIPYRGKPLLTSWEPELLRYPLRFNYTVGPKEDEHKSDAELRVYVQRTLQFQPGRIDFGQVSERLHSLQQPINLELGHDIADVEASVPAEWRLAWQRKIAVGTRWRLEGVLTATGLNPLGPFTSSIRVAPRTNDGTLLPERAWPMTGTVVRDVMTVPPSIHVGRVEIGQRIREQIAFRSRTEQPFTVRLDPQFPKHAADLVQITETAAGVFTVQFVVQQHNEHHLVNIPFRVRDVAGVEYEVHVGIRYYGV